MMTVQIFKSKFYRELLIGLPAIVLFLALMHYLEYSWIFFLISIVFIIFVLFCIDVLSVLHIQINSHGVKRFAPYKCLGFLSFGRQFDLPYNKIHRIELRCEGTHPLKLVITSTNFWQYSVCSLAYRDFNKLIATIQQNIYFDSNPIDTEHLQGEDVGQRAANLLLIAVVLNTLALFSASFLSLMHVSSEHWELWLLITVPVAIVPSYLWIRGEKKANPLATSIIIGCLLGIGINLMLLMLNRFYTEKSAMVYVHAFVLLEADQKQQKWQLPSQIDTKKQMFYIHAKNNPGYMNTLKSGHTYQITIKKGFLNDWAFAPDAFKKAKEIKAAPQPGK